MMVCNRCVMDKTTRNIYFNEEGICNYCTEFENISFEPKLDELDSLVQKIKKDGEGKPYDCIIGVSGGVDSSYVLHLAIEKGLRPLAVHMDNTWNAEIATNNISNLVRKLNVDLYTHVIKWKEYKNLLLSFMRANVVDLELLYDNAMWGVNLSLAKKYKIKYILSGSNISTEGFNIPEDWNWFKLDKKNIIDIYSKFSESNKPLTSFSFASTLDYYLYQKLYGGKWVSFLDYFDYNKNEALNLLRVKYNYKPYPFKHYESVLTRFYQGYILPTKFNIDKRKLHYSNLIMTKQMSRVEALKELEKMPYESEHLLKIDKKFFLKRMGMSTEDFNFYLRQPCQKHEFYKSEAWIKNIKKKFSAI